MLAARIPPLRTPVENPGIATSFRLASQFSFCNPVKNQRKTEKTQKHCQPKPMKTLTSAHALALNHHFPQIQLKYPLPRRGHLDILVKSPQARVKRRNGRSKFDSLK